MNFGFGSRGGVGVERSQTTLQYTTKQPTTVLGDDVRILGGCVGGKSRFGWANLVLPHDGTQIYTPTGAVAPLDRRASPTLSTRHTTHHNALHGHTTRIQSRSCILCHPIPPLTIANAPGVYADSTQLNQHRGKQPPSILLQTRASPGLSFVSRHLAKFSFAPISNTGLACLHRFTEDISIDGQSISLHFDAPVLLWGSEPSGSVVVPPVELNSRASSEFAANVLKGCMPNAHTHILGILS